MLRLTRKGLSHTPVFATLELLANCVRDFRCRKQTVTSVILVAPEIAIILRHFLLTLMPKRSYGNLTQSKYFLKLLGVQQYN